MVGGAVSRRFVGLAFAAMAVLAPQVALACPFCAGRAKSGIATNVILGLFVSLPFLISWLIYRFIRNNAETTAAPVLPSPAAYNRSRRTVQ
jgi:hypothetical protein